MRTASIPFAICFTYLCASPAAAQPDATTRPGERMAPYIEVSGLASVSLVPDQAQVTAGVTTEAKTVREASDANAGRMQAILATLRELNIAEADIQTARFGIHPVYAQGRPGRPEEPHIAGYRVSNHVRVKLRDLARLAGVLDRLVAAGATDIQGISFEVAETSKVLDGIRSQAVAEARRKAEIYARAADAQVGRVLAIRESGSPAPPRPLAMAAEQRAAASTPISPGESSFRVEVNATFELIR